MSRRKRRNRLAQQATRQRTPFQLQSASQQTHRSGQATKSTSLVVCNSQPSSSGNSSGGQTGNGTWQLEPAKAKDWKIPIPIPVQGKLRFSPLAWAKLTFIRDLGPTEVGFFGITSRENLLFIEDVVMVKQTCTTATVKFDDVSVADFFEDQVDAGRHPEQFGRIWLHTHPSDSPRPSGVDEDTFREVFGNCHWAIMFILAKGGQTFARLRFNVGPGYEIEVPVEVVLNCNFTGCDHKAWADEYERCVNVERWVTKWYGGNSQQGGFATGKSDGYDATYDVMDGNDGLRFPSERVPYRASMAPATTTIRSRADKNDGYGPSSVEHRNASHPGRETTRLHKQGTGLYEVSAELDIAAVRGICGEDPEINAHIRRYEELAWYSKGIGLTKDEYDEFYEIEEVLSEVEWVALHADATDIDPADTVKDELDTASEVAASGFQEQQSSAAGETVAAGERTPEGGYTD